jgi:UDPglucose 6-dehydrogenase
VKWFNPEHNHLFERISYHETALEAIQGTDALFISTDWEEFRGLSSTIRKGTRPPYLIIDGRRMIPDHDMLVDLGYQYLSVGGVLLSPVKGSERHGEGIAIAEPDGKLVKESG